ncbi:MAG: hypothetical protein ACI4SA_01430 [Lachnospiraceae bacterium]
MDRHSTGKTGRKQEKAKEGKSVDRHSTGKTGRKQEKPKEGKSRDRIDDKKQLKTGCKR